MLDVRCTEIGGFPPGDAEPVIETGYLKNGLYVSAADMPEYAMRACGASFDAKAPDAKEAEAALLEWYVSDWHKMTRERWEDSDGV